MTFAVRPIGLYGKRWEFVGAGAVSTGASANFPSTAQAGDLAVWCGSVTSSGAPPSGWPLIAAGATLQGYKVCAGGETSASWGSRSGTTRAIILLFRPVGGSAVLHTSATDSPATMRTMAAGDSPSLIVAIGNYTDSFSGWDVTLPGAWNTVHDSTIAPAFYTAWRTMEAGESTGSMRLTTAGARQTFGIWGIA